MKKKLMAILLTAVMVLSMTSSAFAATTAEEIPGAVATQMVQTVDWYATQNYNNLIPCTPEQIVDAYYPSFLVASSGVKTEATTNLTAQFVKAVEDSLAAHNNVLFAKHKSNLAQADSFQYAGVIAALTVLGKNPKSFAGVDLVAQFATQVETEWFYPNTANPAYSYWAPKADLSKDQSPYNFGLVLSVLKKYKSDIAKADEMTNAILTVCNGSTSWDPQYFYQDGIHGKKYVANKDESLSINVNKVFQEGAFDGLTKGELEQDPTTYDISIKTAGDYYIDDNGWYHIDTTNKDTILATLKNKVQSGLEISSTLDSYTAGGATHYIIVPTTIEGSGIYHYEFSSDNDSKFIGFLAGYSDDQTKKAVATLKELVLGLQESDGTVKYSNAYSGSADSTGLALAAAAITGDKTNATKRYAGLLTFINPDTGAAQVGYTGTIHDDEYATKDALDGIISYYRFLAGQSDFYSLTPATLPTATQEEKYDIVKTGEAGEKITYKQGTGNGFSLKSNAEILKFVCVLVDGKVVPMKHVKVEEGSTIVTIDSEYMDALDAGTHTITIQSTDGFATASFTVTGAAPLTGDANMILLFATLAVISGLGLAAYGKKKYMR